LVKTGADGAERWVDVMHINRRRMEKSPSMRWPRRGADLLLQVRCAGCNGTLGSGFGQRFHPGNDQHPQEAIAA